MGIGRRNFLKISSLALAGLAVDPLQAVVTNNNVYVNKKLGILFYKPDNWGFYSLKDFGKLKDKQILGNGMDDYKDEVWEDLGAPICIVTKYYQDKPENKGLFSPTITLNITPKSAFDEDDFESFEELMELSAYGAARVLRDFRIVKRHEPYTISGCKFYEHDAEYLFEHVDMEKPVTVELKVIKAEHGNFYYDFNCHQSKEANQLANKEFEAFKKSIKLI